MSGGRPTIRARAGDLLGSEWVKLRSLRSNYLALGAAAAAALIAGTWAAATVKPSQIHSATFDPVQVSFTGMLVAQLVFGVLGVLAISSEYTTGTIYTTLAAAPRRRAVLAAKAAVVGTVALVAGETIAFVTFLAGQAVLHSKNVSLSLADPGVLRAVAAGGFYLFVVTLVGLGLGAIIRHTAGAVAAVGLIFIQALLVNLIFPDPDSSAGHFVLFWSGQAISSVRAHVAGYAPVGEAALVCVAYAAAALGVATYLITIRDA